MRLPLSLLLLLFSFNTAISQSNWPQWRGPDGSGISTEKNLPTERSDTKNIRWKTAIPGRGHSSPVIWGSRIFVTSSAKIIAYDPGTGKELWRAPGVVSNPIPSPVANKDFVFVTAGSAEKRAIAIKLGGVGDLTNTTNIAWQYDKGTAYVPSPILYHEYLYLVSDAGAVTCLEAATGKVIYQARMPVAAKFTASPVAFDEKILLVSEDGDSFVLQAGAEPKVLNANGLGEPVYASPAIASGNILIRGESNLYCISKL